jgi:hypothetical protein
MSYPFALPTTGSVAIAEFFESLGSYSRQISEATAQRGRLRAALKSIKRQEQLNKDYQEVINVGVCANSSLLFKAPKLNNHAVLDDR